MGVLWQMRAGTATSSPQAARTALCTVITGYDVAKWLLYILYYLCMVANQIHQSTLIATYILNEYHYLCGIN